MRKLLLLFLAVLLNAFTISKSETFKKSYPAEIMKTSFNLEMKNSDSDKITKTFNEIIKEAKKSKICEGGKFSITPNYEWENGKDVFKGYKGYIRFSCTFKDTKKYAKLLAKVKRKKGIIFTQNEINYIAPTQNSTKELEDKAYKYAINYTKYLSKTFNTKCEIASITLYQDYFRPTFYRSFSKSFTKSTPIELPIQKSISIKLKVDYLFKCD